MKKRMSIVLSLLLAAGMLAGCGEAENRNQNSALSDQSSELSVEVEQSIEEAWIVEMPVSELTGDEDERTITIAEGCSVYARPNAQATTCGYLAEEDKVTALSLVENGDWCKISYNGRVAYILADVMEGTEELTVTETVQEAITTRPSTSTSTTRPSTSTGNSTTTGNTTGGNTTTGGNSTTGDSTTAGGTTTTPTTPTAPTTPTTPDVQEPAGGDSGTGNESSSGSTNTGSGDSVGGSTGGDSTGDDSASSDTTGDTGSDSIGDTSGDTSGTDALSIEE